MPIDLTTLNALRILGTDKDPDFINRMIVLYLSSTQNHITNLKKAFNNNDLELLTNATHSMKSSSGNIGALQLMKLCGELETNCRRNMLDDNDRLVELIGKEFIKVQNYLKNI